MCTFHVVFFHSRHLFVFFECVQVNCVGRTKESPQKTTANKVTKPNKLDGVIFRFLLAPFRHPLIVELRAPRLALSICQWTFCDLVKRTVCGQIGNELKRDKWPERKSRKVKTVPVSTKGYRTNEPNGTFVGVITKPNYVQSDECVCGASLCCGGCKVPRRGTGIVRASKSLHTCQSGHNGAPFCGPFAHSSRSCLLCLSD